MNMKYKITQFNDFVEPYSENRKGEYGPTVEHRSVDEYETADFETFKKIIADITDAPAKEMTIEDVRRDFETLDVVKLSDASVKSIMVYYNDRLKLKTKIEADLATVDMSGIGKTVELKYQIPFEMNYFSCEDPDDYRKRIKMVDAYIKIEVSKGN